MKKNMIMLLTGMGLLVSACSKSHEDCDPNDQESACYAGPNGNQKMLLTEEIRNGKTELVFEYDDQNRVNINYIYPRDGGARQSQHFTYNQADQLITVDHRKGSEHIYSEKYTYGANGNPTSAVWEYDDTDVSIQYTYVENTVTETAISPDGDVIGLNTYSFDSKGNPSKIIFSGGGITQSTQEFGDYDDRPYRFTNYPWTWKLKSINNAKNYKLTANVPGGPTITIQQKWEYTYNGAGYPIEAKVYDLPSNELTETRTYLYKAAK
jgi:hypothetical protein